MDMSKIQRALGFIEGVCQGLTDKEAELIEEAVVEIDCALECRNPVIQDPFRLNGVQFEESDWLTSAEMEDLTERLKKHFVEYQNGKSQRFDVVCRDCLMAALAITQLGNALDNQSSASYMERP